MNDCHNKYKSFNNITMKSGIPEKKLELSKSSSNDDFKE